MSRAHHAFVAAVLLAVAPGCVSMMEMCGYKSPPPPPPPVKEIMAAFSDEVNFVADTVSNQRRFPGLVARVYLMSGGLKSVMVEATGSIRAEMYDATPGVQPTKLAEWNFDPHALALLKHTDMVGMGYTILFPWEGYRPEIKRVQIRMWYIEEGQQPRFTEQVVSLRPTDQRPITQLITSTEVPALRAALMPR